MYGASETLHDYLDLGPPNVLDSLTAQQYAALAQAQAWISATAPMFLLEITALDWMPDDPTVVAFSMVSGYASYAGDAPPAGFPAVTRVQSGEYTIAPAASYTDEASVAGAFDATYLLAGATDAQYDTYANLVKVSSTELTLYIRDWSSGGTLQANKTSFVEIV